LRQHERTTREGRELQERVNAYHVGAIGWSSPTSCHRAMVDFAHALDALASMLRDDIVSTYGGDRSSTRLITTALSDSTRALF